MLQSWYADDSNAAGRLRALKRWWDTLNELGPKYGYFSKPIKTVKLLVNDRSQFKIYSMAHGTTCDKRLASLYSRNKALIDLLSKNK